MRFIGYGRQSLDDSDIEAVVSVLRGDTLTQGPTVAAFESDLAAYVGARYAVAVANGTAALHMACLAAGLKPGDVGVTQPLTFVASANCIAYCGARPDLVDVDPHSLTMSPAGLAEYLRATPECRVVIPVAFGGLSSHGPALREIAGDRVIIEDACHALGGALEGGAKVGGGGYADMTVYSFHPVKPITTGEGGAIVTDREDLYQALLQLRSHGIIRGGGKIVDADKAALPWYYEQQVLGFNYRLTDLQAALGITQLRRLDNFIRRRRDIAAAYDQAFAGQPGLRLVQSAPSQRALSGHHLYVVRMDFDADGRRRRTMMDQLSALGIGTQVHYIPVYHQPYHRARFTDAARRFPVCEQHYQECLTLPCYPGMTDEDIARVTDALLRTAPVPEAV